MTALVTKHLSLVAGAPDGIKKLRELILDLAIQGRLLPQNPDDEPAETLLSKLTNDRQQQVRSKTIRAAKGILPALRNDVGFSIPGCWVPVRLGEIGDWGAGATPARSNPAYYGGATPWFKSGELTSDLIDTAEESVTDLALKECSLRLNQPGDVLIAMYGATIGKTAILAVPATTNQAVCACTPFEGVYNRFLLVVLKALKRQFVGQGAGGAQPNISKEKIVATAIGLPPELEQHRIVAKVDELMALCDRLEADQADAEAAHAQLVQALLDSLTQATDAADFRASWQRLSEHFHTLFTTEASMDALKRTVLQLAVMGKLDSQCSADDNVENLLAAIKSKKAALHQERLISKPRSYVDSPEFDPPWDIPSAWRWARLGELGITSTGSTPPTSRLECFGGATPFIGPGQIDVNGQISFGDKSLSDVGLAVSTIASPGDILMVCIGGSIGKSAMAQARIAFNQQINSISVLLANGGYVNLAMMSPYFQSQVLDAATGSATPIINRSKWEDICVPVPPLAEQHRIVTKVDELMALCDQLKAQLAAGRQQQAQLATVLVEQAVA